MIFVIAFILVALGFIVLKIDDSKNPWYITKTQKAAIVVMCCGYLGMATSVLMFLWKVLP